MFAAFNNLSYARFVYNVIKKITIVYEQKRHIFNIWLGQYNKYQDKYLPMALGCIACKRVHRGRHARIHRIRFSAKPRLSVAVFPARKIKTALINQWNLLHFGNIEKYWEDVCMCFTYIWFQLFRWSWKTRYDLLQLLVKDI